MECCSGTAYTENNNVDHVWRAKCIKRMVKLCEYALTDDTILHMELCFKGLYCTALLMCAGLAWLSFGSVAYAIRYDSLLSDCVYTQWVRLCVATPTKVLYIS